MIIQLRLLSQQYDQIILSKRGEQEKKNRLKVWQSRMDQLARDILNCSHQSEASSENLYETISASPLARLCSPDTYTASSVSVALAKDAAAVLTSMNRFVSPSSSEALPLIIAFFALSLFKASLIKENTFYALMPLLVQAITASDKKESQLNEAFQQLTRAMAKACNLSESLDALVLKQPSHYALFSCLCYCAKQFGVKSESLTTLTSSLNGKLAAGRSVWKSTSLEEEDIAVDSTVASVLERCFPSDLVDPHSSFFDQPPVPDRSIRDVYYDIEDPKPRYEMLSFCGYGIDYQIYLEEQRRYEEKERKRKERINQLLKL